MSTGLNILVHVKQKCVAVSAGDGLQSVKWLANVAIARHDNDAGRHLGQPAGLRLEDGTVLGLGQTLADAGLRDMQHVWVILKGQPTKGGRDID